jgi:N-acetylneuraminic acid mutarotase
MKLHITFVILIIAFGQLFSQEWQAISSTPSSLISHHTYGFSANDKGYLLTGGLDSGPSKFLIEYNPISNEWTQLADYPGPERHYGIGDALGDKVYIGFGADDNGRLNDLWEYDIVLDSWKKLADCDCETRTHPAFVVTEDKIYVGLGGGNGNLDDWWEYDKASDTWAEKAKFPGARRHHPYQFAIGDYIYVGLGHGAEIYNDWYRYDPENDEWTQMANLPGEGRVAGTQFAFNGKGYVLSGDGEDHYSMETGEFWCYDPETNAWNQLPPHPGYSRWAPSSFIIGSEVYLSLGITYIFAGGVEGHTSVWKYDLAENTSSVDNLENNFVNIYPNPSHDFISFDIPANIEVNQISIYNLIGKEVYSSTEIESTIDIANLKNGIYTLVLKGKNGLINNNFVKH